MISRQVKNQVADVPPGLVTANAADKLDKYPDNLTSSFVSPLGDTWSIFSGPHPQVDTNQSRMTETHISASGWEKKTYAWLNRI